MSSSTDQDLLERLHRQLQSLSSDELLATERFLLSLRSQQKNKTKTTTQEDVKLHQYDSSSVTAFQQLLLTSLRCAEGESVSLPNPVTQDMVDRSFELSQLQRKQSQVKLGPSTHKRTMLFREYSREMFQQIRRDREGDLSTLRDSLSARFQSLTGTESKGGSWFLMTSDERYIIKSMSKTESHLLRQVTLSLYAHWQSYPDSLILPILGHFSITAEHSRGREYLMLLPNVFYSPLGQISRIYDLKGSKIGRGNQPGDRVLKDLTFTENNETITLTRPGAALAYQTQLKLDSQLLGSLNLMDYSLLLGIYDPNNRDNPSRTADNAGRHEHKEHRELQESQGRNANTLTKPRGLKTKIHTAFSYLEGVSGASTPPPTTTSTQSPNNPNHPRTAQPVVFYSGIIDILSEYGNSKKIAHAYKSVKFAGDSDHLSTVPSAQYASRFYEFVSKAVVQAPTAHDSS